MNTKDTKHVPSKFKTYLAQKEETEKVDRDFLDRYLRAFNCSEDEIDKAYNTIKARFGSIRSAVRCNYMGCLEPINQKVDTLLHLLPQFSKRVLDVNPILNRHSFRGIDDCMHYIIQTLKNETAEVFYVLYLSSDLKLLHALRLTGLSLEHIDVDIRSLLMNCPMIEECGILVAHNHNSFSSEPSASDISFTNTLLEVCSNVGVPLIDHLVTYKDGGFCILSGKSYSKSAHSSST